MKKIFLKREFYKIAKSLDAEILTYKTYRSFGMGGLQVYEISAIVRGKMLNFADSYFHQSGDEQKVLDQFKTELTIK